MTLATGIKAYIETLIEKEKALQCSIADIKAAKHASPVQFHALNRYDDKIQEEYREYLATMTIRCDLEHVLEKNGYHRTHIIDVTANKE